MSGTDCVSTICSSSGYCEGESSTSDTCIFADCASGYCCGGVCSPTVCSVATGCRIDGDCIHAKCMAGMCAAIGGESCATASCSSGATPALACCSSTLVCADHAITYCSLGDSCSGINECEPSSLYCSTVATTCTALIIDGNTCTTSVSCVSGLCCDGTCRTQCLVGESCTIASQCASGYCDTATTHACQLRPLLTACTLDSQCASTYCDTSALTCRGTCTSLCL